ncbi:ribonuclease III domain-containing protein [Dichotomopilus funicola]|uniref:Large ribosomal subunit protein mL44 n=1 Tax=Dichotomopilus funicola TaxID=1934379 RepID=A0AAN6ZR02_9PEZI|nr:ribonuclease III domain-containing protein [Dichotomopilus funicola]
MKRLRFDRWTGQLPLTRAGSALGSTSMPRPGVSVATISPRCTAVRYQSTLQNTSVWQGNPTTLESDGPYEQYKLYEEDDGTDHERFPPLEELPEKATTLPSPPPERALQSAKLAALHARLSLPERLPLQTLARALVDASADEDARFNNTNLAFVGQSLIHYHVAEWLMCRYPRLPMDIMYAAMRGYAGPATLHQVARSWGIEHAAAPGGEVDPGLLQFSQQRVGDSITAFGYRRTESKAVQKLRWRHGLSSRVVFDDDFGDMIDVEDSRAELMARANTEWGNEYTRALAERAFANCTRAITGALYAHAGREAAASFIKAHILSRTLNMTYLFAFKKPTRELSLLCAREEFEPPVARLLSETGRASRTPVFVVGIFSGKDKLGEGQAANLNSARHQAAMNALKSWYLYSPGEDTRLPSEMLTEGAKPWEPAYIDIGEIISR